MSQRINLGNSSNGVFEWEKGTQLGSNRLIIGQNDQEIKLDLNGLRAVVSFYLAMGFEMPSTGEVATWQRDIAELTKQAQAQASGGGQCQSMTVPQ